MDDHEDDFDAARGILVAMLLSAGLVFVAALLWHAAAAWVAS